MPERGEFTFFADVGARDAGENDHKFPIYGEAATASLDRMNNYITQAAIDDMIEDAREDGGVDITVGPDHIQALSNAAGVVGWAYPAVDQETGKFVIQGHLNPEHRDAPGIFYGLQNHPEKYKLSVGGFVPSDMVSQSINEDGETERVIEGYKLDHIFLCRAGAAKNPETWISVDDEAEQPELHAAAVDQQWDEVLFQAASGIELEEMEDEFIAQAVPEYQDFPTAPKDREWDGDEADENLREWAGGPDKEEIDWEKYRKGFLYYDPDNKESFSDGYKFPIADVIDGDPHVVWNGVVAARGYLSKADISDDDKSAIENQLKKYYEKFDEDWDSEDNSESEGQAMSVNPFTAAGQIVRGIFGIEDEGAEALFQADDEESDEDEEESEAEPAEEEEGEGEIPGTPETTDEDDEKDGDSGVGEKLDEIVNVVSGLNERMDSVEEQTASALAASQNDEQEEAEAGNEGESEQTTESAPPPEPSENDESGNEDEETDGFVTEEQIEEHLEVVYGTLKQLTDRMDAVEEAVNQGFKGPGLEGSRQLPHGGVNTENDDDNSSSNVDTLLHDTRYGSEKPRS